MAYIYGTGLVASRIFEGLPENPLIEAVLTSSIKSTNMSSACIGANLSSYTYKADKYYAYGRDQTSNGLPFAFSFNQLFIVDYNDPNFFLDAVIAGTTSTETPTSIIYSVYGFLRPTFIGRYFLQSDVRYTMLSTFDDANTIFTDDNTGFRYVALADTGSPYITLTSLGYARGDISIDWVSQFKAEITIKGRRVNPANNTIYGVGNSPELAGELIIKKLLNGPTRIGKFYQIWYYIAEDTIPHYYWYDPYAQQKLDEGRDFYPVAIIRRDATQLLDQVGVLEYADETERLLDRLGLSMTELTDAISASPDEASIDDAYVTFAADVDSDIQVEMHYLYEYFKHYHYSIEKLETAQADFVAGWVSYNQWTYTGGSIIVRGAERDDSAILNWGAKTDYNSEYRWGYTSLQVKSGVYNVGVTRPYPTTIVPFVAGIDLNNSGIGRISKTIYRGDTSGTANEEDVLVYRKQLTTLADDGADTYAELVICALSTATLVQSGLNRVVFNLRNILDNDPQTSLHLLLSRDIVKSFGTSNESRLMHQCLRIVMYALVRQKLEWYETKVFKDILMIIAIVIIIYTLGTGSEGAAALFEIALVDVTMSQIFIYFVVQVVYSIAIKAAFREIAKAIGGEAALVLAAIALAYGATDLEIFGGSGLSFNGMISAAQALNFATLGMTAATEVIYDDYLGILKDHKEWLLESDKQTAELQAEIDAYNSIYHGVDLLNAIKGRTEHRVIVETPTEMYNRMIHATNLTDATLQAVAEYTDTMLTLPQIKYT